MRASELVLYIDRAVVVLNKPPGFVSQLSHGNDLHRGLEEIKDRFRLRSAPLPIHRLDKDTTGCLVFARTHNAAKQLSTQFQQNEVQKTYLALVRGGRQSFAQTSGIIREPLLQKDGRVSVAKLGHPDAQNSVTEWSLVASSPSLPLSLLQLRLHTGHKHQLRVHLSQVLKSRLPRLLDVCNVPLTHLLAPILGDSVHSISPPTEQIQRALSRLRPKPERERMFLHAAQLSFFRYRPSGGNRRFRLLVGAPLPDDFHQLLKEARIPLSKPLLQGGLYQRDKEAMEYEQVPNGIIDSVEGRWMPDESYTAPY
ncbi:Pseudouridine synthase [Mycena kentingensis (nom. inval.)]|nr:Pseudouridine synthase [Mycena kentingensis (nom. inval.)]